MNIPAGNVESDWMPPSRKMPGTGHLEPGVPAEAIEIAKDRDSRQRSPYQFKVRKRCGACWAR